MPNFKNLHRASASRRLDSSQRKLPLWIKLNILAVFAAFFGWPEMVHAAENVAITPNAPLNERVLSVPGDDEDPAVLQVMVLSPNGPGPFPTVIMNHGSAGTSRPDLEPRYRYSFSSYYFLSRGYAVVLPMMRGFAGSGGKQKYDGCNQVDVGMANAMDIRAVINFMTSQPFIDGKRLVVAGQSFGGWNTLALGALDLPKVRGLINFAGGAAISNCRSTQLALATGARLFGRMTRAPSLWFYGDNDSKFSPPVWRSMFANYTGAGGQAQLIAYGQFMSDSHNLLGYPEGLRIWAPEVDAFLAKIGLPNKLVHPEYLPTPSPPPSHFAAIDDVAAVPHLNVAARQTYRRFLDASMPRAFILSPSGVAGSFNGGFDPIGRGLAACRKVAQNCQIYAVDQDVVWPKE